jgi:hypothetical protein
MPCAKTPRGAAATAATAAGGGVGGIACRYVTSAIVITAEAVTLLLMGLAVDRVGRHNTHAFGQLLGGCACLACAMVSGGTSQTVLAGIGKLGSSSQYNIAALDHTAVQKVSGCMQRGMNVWL